MRRLDSYVAKYGPVDGPQMYTRLQREAALASAHAQHKKRLNAAPPPPPATPLAPTMPPPVTTPADVDE
jgi:hypothetical protein